MNIFLRPSCYFKEISILTLRDSEKYCLWGRTHKEGMGKGGMEKSKRLHLSLVRSCCLSCVLELSLSSGSCLAWSQKWLSPIALQLRCSGQDKLITWHTNDILGAVSFTKTFTCMSHELSSAKFVICWCYGHWPCLQHGHFLDLKCFLATETQCLSMYCVATFTNFSPRAKGRKSACFF